MRSNNQRKRYVVRKFVTARSVNEAVAKEAKLPVDDCFVDEPAEQTPRQLSSAIGFCLSKRREEDDEGEN